RKTLTGSSAKRGNALDHIGRSERFCQIDGLLNGCEIGSGNSDDAPFRGTYLDDFLSTSIAFVGRASPVLHLTGAAPFVGDRSSRLSSIAGDDGGGARSRRRSVFPVGSK